MPKKSQIVTVKPEVIETRIHIVRGVRVMLDSDLAELYGVPTGALNQAVKRNAERFPEDFAFRLTPKELTDLRSQFVIANPGERKRRYHHWVFTEQGVAMLSSVLRSPIAIRVNIEIMRAFIRIRRLLATPGELAAQLAKLAQTVQLHDDQIKAIAEVLKQLTEPSPPPPKRWLGFRQPESSLNSPLAKHAQA
jgi:hypothetical protein